MARHRSLGHSPQSAWEWEFQGTEPSLSGREKHACVTLHRRLVGCISFGSEMDPTLPFLPGAVYTSDFIFLNIICILRSEEMAFPPTWKLFQLTHWFMHFEVFFGFVLFFGFFFFLHIPQLDLSYPFSKRLLTFLAVGRRIKQCLPPA